MDAVIIRVEIIEHWQQLKVHEISLERYLGERKMELLKREVESQWLFNSRLFYVSS